MTREEMRYKLNELRMMLNDGEHGEEQGVLLEIISELDKWEEPPIYTLNSNTLSALSENKGEWIPVSERLPEESKNYLVIIREKFNKKHWWIDICDIDTEGFAKTWNVREPYYVEAWQPLPEPYKARKVR